MKCGLVALQDSSQLPIWPKISERLRRGCGDGEAKRRGRGAQPGPPRGHGRTGAAPHGAAVLLSSEGAADGGKSRKAKFRKVPVCGQRGAHLRALDFSRESGYHVHGCLFRSIYNTPRFDLAGLGFQEIPSRAGKAELRINRSLLLRLCMSSYGTRAYG